MSLIILRLIGDETDYILNIIVFAGKNLENSNYHSGLPKLNIMQTF
jgi:hypothetical protein